MKRHFLFLSLLFSVAFLIFGCQKEFSFENGGAASVGSLQSDVGGDCLPKTVAGTYEAGTAVTTAEYIEVQVNVTTTGSYTIYTDTLNGIYFRASGVFTATGLNTVRLKATGTPVNAGIDNFTVNYDGTECSIAVTTLPAGAGSPAVFTLAGAPNACTSFTVAGTYTAGVQLTGSNTVTINVTVTAIGTYNISTPASNGMTFAASGAFLTTGTQTVTLNGTGTPVASGPPTNFSITAGSSTCSFSITVAGAATYTVNCGTAVAGGTFTQNTALDATNNVNIGVTVTAVGGYTITATGGGMTFSGSGTFSSTGPQTVVLNASGTPSTPGPATINVTGGTAGCSFQVTVVAGAAVDWKFNVTGVTATFQGTLDAAQLQASGPITAFGYAGSTSTGESFTFALADVSGGIQNNETYSSSATVTNAVLFEYDDASANAIYTADPTTAGVTMTFKVTSINTTTKVISGTFSGTCKDASNVTKTITNGTFQGTYQ